jgi:hypothetical protein
MPRSAINPTDKHVGMRWQSDDQERIVAKRTLPLRFLCRPHHTHADSTDNQASSTPDLAESCTGMTNDNPRSSKSICFTTVLY